MAALGVGLVGTVLAALPAARISDRTGRKPIVWAAALIASTGILILATAPDPPVALVGAFFLGAGSGAYLAVDWALMTEIIPVASSGRYMGLANIANSIAGPVGLLMAGPVMDAFYDAGEIELGPRVAVGLGRLRPGRCVRHPHRCPPASGSACSRRRECRDMTTMAVRSIRIAGKAMLWLVLLGLIGLIGLLMVGWIPPELAAMLGSRRWPGGQDADAGRRDNVPEVDSIEHEH